MDVTEPILILHFCLSVYVKIVQGGDSVCADDDNFDWDSEDEREIDNHGLSSSSTLTLPAEATASSAEVMII